MARRTPEKRRNKIFRPLLFVMHGPVAGGCQAVQVGFSVTGALRPCPEPGGGSYTLGWRDGVDPDETLFNAERHRPE